jgi:hypothetical protein
MTVIPFLAIYLKVKEVFIIQMNVYINLICNIPKLETTQVSIYKLTNKLYICIQWNTIQ